ncbi:MAG: DNA polymerase III subunit delta' [Magnetococcales bacterium]|nr:DNA polymerase III subunit delta' [Magnetococcales bacterium]NGZ25888.1 DNA polymerase III subunit delta' [Magnetococcales bacterium]
MPSAVFEGIAGHGEVIHRLLSMMEGERLPHALLFHGPPGIGKNTTAIALIQTLFCLQTIKGSGQGCGVCVGCRKVVSGNHPDLLRVEMGEDKTRILVEQIRELSRFFNLTPLEGNWKICLLDDAGQMNDAAANALLKTLEEPPGKSLLILITSRLDSLLPTIRSRCQSLRFSPLSDEVLVALAQSKANLNGEAARDLAPLAEGSVARLLQLANSEFASLRQDFLQTMDKLPSGDLSQLVQAAAQWADKERYATTTTLLRGWFRQKIHVTMGVEGDSGYKKELLALATQVHALLQRGHVFNLNKQLILEAIFIRHYRLHRHLSGGPSQR